MFCAQKAEPYWLRLRFRKNNYMMKPENHNITIPAGSEFTSDSASVSDLTGALFSAAMFCKMEIFGSGQNLMLLCAPRFRKVLKIFTYLIYLHADYTLNIT